MTDLNIVFAHNSTDAVEAISLIGLEVDSLGLNSEFAVYGKISTPKKAVQQAKRSGRPSFDIEFGTYNIGLCPIANREIDVLRITMDPSRSIDEVFTRFVGIGDFVHAWAIDRDYNYWQNAFDPIQFDSAGRSYEGLSMKSNGWPPPREKLIIDVSQNPGREILRTGFVEAVGGVLWLSNVFHNRTGCDPSALEQNLNLEYTSIGETQRFEIDKNLLAGADEDPAIANQLNSIRQLLYPNAVQI